MKLLASKESVRIFEFAKAHRFLPEDLSSGRDPPPPSEDIGFYDLLNEDDESSFGASKLRFFLPIKGALLDDDGSRSVFLNDGFDDLSTPVTILPL